MGGGFGIHYRKQEALPARAFAEVIVPAVQGRRAASWSWSRAGSSSATPASWSAG